jgi:DNA invertase Pin-like site-specific DNA recombinase
MATLKPDETFLVWKNYRAFRSLKDGFFAMERFRETGVTYRSLTEFIDTSKPVGRAMFYILNIFAELEGEIIAERTRAGLDAAYRNGKILARRCKPSCNQVAWGASSAYGAGPDERRHCTRAMHLIGRTLRRSVASFAAEGPSRLR